MAKTKKLNDKETAETFEIVIGFNVPDGKGGEKRFDSGKVRPKFVTADDFTPESWKALVQMGAVVPVTKDDPTIPTGDEQIVFEVTE